MNTKTKVDISKFSVSLLHSTYSEKKGPCVFVGHRFMDIGQIWIMSAKENKWVLQDQGSYQFMLGHWEDTREHLKTDEDLLNDGISETDVLNSENPCIVKGHVKIQKNCWLDLSY